MDEKASEFAAPASSNGGGFSSRLLMDVVAAQLAPSPEAQLALLESERADPSETYAEAAGGPWPTSSSSAPDASRPATALSVAALARAEQALDKPVSIINGGSHVAFSSEDIGRIRDPAVLQFMEENSSLFSRYLKERADGNGGEMPLTEGGTAGETTASRVEADILSLQKEIETFITAVDEDGKNYRILTNEEGNVLVPVADVFDDGDAGDVEDLEDSSMDNAAETAAAEQDEAPSHGSPVLPHPAAVDGATAPLEEESSVGDSDTPTAESRPARSHTPTVPAPPPAKKGGVVKGRLSRPANGPAGKGKKRPSFPQTTTGAPPGPKREGRRCRERSKATPAAAHRAVVRPVRALLPEEEERVEQLLREDLTAAHSSPFAMSAEAVRRLTEIDERLSTLRVARRALQTAPDGEAPGATEEATSTSETNATAEAVGSAEAPSVGALSATHARDLGNEHMKQSVAAVQHRRKMEQVNARLLRIQQEVAQLTVLADTTGADLPADVRALRPAWADAAPLTELPDEETVAGMLEEAAEEQRRREVLGVRGTAATEGDGPVYAGSTGPYATLRESLDAARKRAMALLASENETGADERGEPVEQEKALSPQATESHPALLE